MATGAACGICTAFRAPLAGVMFVVEEAATFFTTNHLEYTFLACMFLFFFWTHGGQVSCLMIVTHFLDLFFLYLCIFLNDRFSLSSLMLSFFFLFIFLLLSKPGLVSYWVVWAFHFSDEGNSSVKFKQTTGEFCTYHDVLDYIFFVLVGILGGVLGALFNQIVEYLSHLRVHHVNKSACRRLLEVIFICLLTGTVSVLLPAAYACKQEIRTIVMEDSAGCLNDADRFQISQGSVSHPFFVDLLKTANCSVTASTSSGSSSSGSGSSRMLLASTTASSAATSSAASSGAGSGAGSGASAPLNLNEILDDLNKYKHSSDARESDVVWIDNYAPYIHLHYSHTYVCDTKNHEYNEMAMLWLNGGVKAVKVLLQRGFPHMLSAHCLIVFCIIYFILAAITAGISVPAGLVVPMLLIGGSYGRLVGLGVLDLKKSMCTEYATLDPTLAFSNTYYWSTYTRWMVKTCRMPDPGTFAIIGAASFLGGSGRITVMLATVLLELTDDASMIAPVGIVCILAMLCGNLFNHGLYHGLIPLIDVPFLNVDPPLEARLGK